jgi:hypothetical protein
VGDFKQKQHYYVWKKMMKYDEDMIIVQNLHPDIENGLFF